MRELSLRLEHQVLAEEKRAESYKDALVGKLEGLLSEERSRADRMLTKYNLLWTRLHLAKANSPKPKQQTPRQKRPAFSYKEDDSSSSDKEQEGKKKEGGRRLFKKWLAP